MKTAYSDIQDWTRNVIKDDEVIRYLDAGQDFIDEPQIMRLLADDQPPSAEEVRDIIQRAMAVQTLLPEQTAALMRVRDQGLWEQIFDAAAKVKRTVYDNRVVTFAPIYIGNLCANNCLYCGFRKENSVIKRRVLSLDEVKRETEVLAGVIGHKRLIAVYGEHPLTGADFISASLKAIYSVKFPVRKSCGEIRRVNVNAAPMCISDLEQIKQAGIGTYQVFQETYHKQTYSAVHPQGTIKADYRWRLYALHRAMEAGIDDVAVGALFGLYDWRFEVMGMLYHARDLEKRFGIGPHTVSVPRIEPAANTPFTSQSHYRVSDEDFKRLIAVLRLSIPYAGLIITCREQPQFIRDVIPMCTQRDASSRIGIGAYSDSYESQEGERQQFILGDTRSLDEVIRELAGMGYITSFCTAGYRCGRTGKNIMTLLRTGKEGCFCKLNAVLTFQEWLEDFASPQTKAIGEKIIAREIAEIKDRPNDFPPQLYESFYGYFERIKRGERDLCF